jgi:tRNA (mo5U34)-methyltransferase
MGVRLTPTGLEVDATWSADEFHALEQRIAEAVSFGYYHQIAIRDQRGQTLVTPGTHLTHGVIAAFDTMGFPADLRGQRVLDIGCNAGFYSIVARLRGADHVVGIDPNPHYVRQADLTREIVGLDGGVEFRVGDETSLSAAVDAFDFVINTGVIYHLQNPMDFLRRVRAVTRGTMFLETEMLTDPAHAEYAWFIEHEYGGDPSNWWIYGPMCTERMARAAGFSTVDFRGFVWKPAPGTRTVEGFLRQGRGVLICRT